MAHTNIERGNIERATWMRLAAGGLRLAAGWRMACSEEPKVTGYQAN